MAVERLQNFIGGSWIDSNASETVPVHNPASGELIGECPLSSEAEVDTAVQAAKQAFVEWRRVPVQDRILRLFVLNCVLE